MQIYFPSHLCDGSFFTIFDVGYFLIKTGGYMSEFASNLAASLVPYVPGEQPKDKKYIKLNTNENPYPPSNKVLEAVNRAAAELRLYPDPNADEVRSAAAEYYNRALNLKGTDKLDISNIFAGNGSDEVLAFIFPTFFKGRKIAFADITYSFYPVYASLFETEYKTIPLKDDFSCDLKDYTDDNSGGGIFGIIICNPNAPTSKKLELGDIEALLEDNSKKLVVVDEAYIDFGGETAVGLVNRYNNLIVTQTLSKSRQLAGMRVGLAIACSELISDLNTVKNSFNSYTVDRLAIAAARAAFEDTAYFEETRTKIISTRDRISAELVSLGFDVLPSSANFVFIKPPKVAAKEMFLKLREKGVLVRYFDKPRINDRLRVTIGTGEEMDRFVEIIREILNV